MESEEQYREMWKKLFGSYQGRRFGTKRLGLKRGPKQVDRLGEFLPSPRLPTLGMVVVYPRPDTGPLRDLCSLAHELGHAMSWIKGTRSHQYETAFVKIGSASLSDEDKQAIIEEEVRAWRLGFPLAHEVGFKEADAYVAEASRALAWYYDRLGLPAQPFQLHGDASAV